MDAAGICEFLNANPVFFLATQDGQQPRVRGMLLYRADRESIIFHLSKNKEVHRQIQANPKVELCFYDSKEGIQIRVAGEAYLDESLDLKKEILAKHDFLKPLVEKNGFETFAVYRVKGGVATLWSMAAIGAPKEYIQL